MSSRRPVRSIVASCATQVFRSSGSGPPGSAITDLGRSRPGASRPRSRPRRCGAGSPRCRSCVSRICRSDEACRRETPRGSARAPTTVPWTPSRRARIADTVSPSVPVAASRNAVALGGSGAPATGSRRGRAIGQGRGRRIGAEARQIAAARLGRARAARSGRGRCRSSAPPPHGARRSCDPVRGERPVLVERRDVERQRQARPGAEARVERHAERGLVGGAGPQRRPVGGREDGECARRDQERDRGEWPGGPAQRVGDADPGEARPGRRDPRQARQRGRDEPHRREAAGPGDERRQQREQRVVLVAEPLRGGVAARRGQDRDRREHHRRHVARADAACGAGPPRCAGCPRAGATARVRARASGDERATRQRVAHELAAVDVLVGGDGVAPRRSPPARPGRCPASTGHPASAAVNTERLPAGGAAAGEQLRAAAWSSRRPSAASATNAASTATSWPPTSSSRRDEARARAAAPTRASSGAVSTMPLRSTSAAAAAVARSRAPSPATRSVSGRGSRPSRSCAGSGRRLVGVQPLDVGRRAAPACRGPGSNVPASTTGSVSTARPTISIPSDGIERRAAASRSAAPRSARSAHGPGSRPDVRRTAAARPRRRPAGTCRRGRRTARAA